MIAFSKPFPFRPLILLAAVMLAIKKNNFILLLKVEQVNSITKMVQSCVQIRILQNKFPET